jgi:hypothetical protein
MPHGHILGDKVNTGLFVWRCTRHLGADCHAEKDFIGLQLMPSKHGVLKWN